MSATILVVDDDASLSEMIGILLQSEGFTVVSAADGEEAQQVFHEKKPDLILLDVMLPTIDGIEVCRYIRRSSNVPIVMLTARTDTADVVAGLEAGADDYIVKPFKPKELIARVKTRLRTQVTSSEEILEAGDLVIDVQRHSVSRSGKDIGLTPLEFTLLVTLLRSPWKVFSREELLESIWGYSGSGDTRLVNVHVQRLRSKIESADGHPEIIQTVRGVGYRAGITE